MKKAIILFLLVIMISNVLAQQQPVVNCPLPKQYTAYGEGKFERVVIGDSQVLPPISSVFEDSVALCTENLRNGEGNTNSIAKLSELCHDYCENSGCVTTIKVSNNACSGNIATDCSPSTIINPIGQTQLSVSCKVKGSAIVSCICKNPGDIVLDLKQIQSGLGQNAGNYLVSLFETVINWFI